MVVDLQIPGTRTRRGRYWLGELPDLRSRQATEVYGNATASPRLVGPTECAIEVQLMGPRTEYGLLAFSFEPHESRDLRIRVNVDDSRSRAFQTDLAGWGPALVGLQSQYVDAVIATIQRCERLSPGTLSIPGAVCTDEGSSRMLFRMLASILLEAIFEGATQLEEVQMSVQHHIDQRRRAV
jgi:hypothetical protein